MNWRPETRFISLHLHHQDIHSHTQGNTLGSVWMQTCPCVAFSVLFQRSEIGSGLDPGLVCDCGGWGGGFHFSPELGVGSRKLRVPCENVAIISTAVADLGAICAPSRASCAVSTAQMHMDTQRCSLSLFSLGFMYTHKKQENDIWKAAVWVFWLCGD